MEPKQITDKLVENIEHLRSLFTHTPDLIIHPVPLKTGQHGVLVYLEGLVDKMSINDHILHPLIYEGNAKTSPCNAVPNGGKTTSESRWSDVEAGLFQGKSALFLEGQPHAVLFDTAGWPQRAIEEPQVESTLKGAHQGFTETASQNIAMVRRYIANRNLKIKQLTVGRRSQTRVYLLYLEDVTHPEVIREMQGRIEKIDIDAVINTGELEQLIEDNPYSPFPQYKVTERPDVAVSHLLQGRAALVVDNSPGVLIGPMVFVSFFQALDDYSTRWMVASFVRLLRFTGLLIGIFLPALYIAAISFHFEILPINLLMSIGESRARVPLPPLMEALLMELTLEMLREAGIRLPSPVGQTVGIVGGIVVGQAAVQAGIVSNIMVIVVSLTAIASFILPDQNMAASIRLIRFPMMLLSAWFGMIGIVIGLTTLVGHLIAAETLGLPYSSPLAPARFGDWKDTFIRIPLQKMLNRPQSAHPVQSTRQSPSAKDRGDDK